MPCEAMAHSPSIWVEVDDCQLWVEGPIGGMRGDWGSVGTCGLKSLLENGMTELVIMGDWGVDIWLDKRMDPSTWQIHHNLCGAETVLRDSLHIHCDQTREGATILNRWCHSVKFRRFVKNNKHRNLCAIFTTIPDLWGLEGIWVQSVDLRWLEDAEMKCFWGCEVVVSDGAGCVKSRYCEEEMGLHLSVRYGSSANKIRCRMSKLNIHLGVEIYFIFGLWASYQKTK